MDFDIWAFIDTPIFCLIVLVYIFYRVHANKITQKQIKLMRVIIMLTIIVVMMDPMYSLVRQNVIQVNYTFFYFYNLIYQMISAFVALFWFLYADASCQKAYVSIRGMVHLACFGQLVCGCTYICLRGYDLFAYQVDGDFVPGPIHFVWGIVRYIPIVASFMLGMLNYRDKKQLFKKEKNLPLVMFPAFIIIAGIVQLIFKHSSIYETGVTIAILYLYSVMSRVMISKDELTALDNRRQFVIDLETQIKDDYDISLMLLDVDKFKAINDTFGHLEGDAALKSVAKVLAGVCRNVGARPYRFGGDEFAIIIPGTDPKISEDLLRILDEELESETTRFDKPYTLRLSSGFVAYDHEKYYTVSDFIEEADARLYSMKKRHNQQN